MTDMSLGEAGSEAEAAEQLPEDEAGVGGSFFFHLDRGGGHAFDGFLGPDPEAQPEDGDADDDADEEEKADNE
jgi:hypothetical protein